MNTLARWVGWTVIVSGGVMLAAALVTFVPYFVLNQCWHYLKTQREFIALASRYFADKRASDRRVMGDQE